MIKNYLLTAFRNIFRHKGFSLINIFGLAISMSVCMLIIVIVIDQYRYDSFQTKKDQIYRVESIDNLSKYSLKNYASTTFPLYKELTTNYAVVEDAVVLNNWFGGTGILSEKRISINGFYTNKSFFNVFDFELTKESQKDPFAEPFSIVMKEETAQKFFGDENPLGKFIQIDSIGDFKITALVKKTNQKSQFQFDILTSVETLEILENNKKIRKITNNWENFYSNYLYILTRKDANLDNIQAALNDISEKKLTNPEKVDFDFYLKPFNKVVPGAFIGNEIGMFLPKIFILFFAGLALVIIISAAFNYTSLSMARSLLRAKEIGIRKTVGARKNQLIFQFLSEAILIAVIACIFAYILLQFILPGFAGMKMMSLLELNPAQDLSVFAWFLVFAIITGFLSGILPAFYMSKFNPIRVLKGVSDIKLLSKITLRKILLVSQFVFSMIFIISIILIYQQMNYMMNANMGFDREFVYNIHLQRNDFQTVKNYYSQFPEVKNIAGASHVAGVGHLNDVEIKLNDGDDNINAHSFTVDENYIDVMGLELLAGTDFPKNTNSAIESFIIIDESTCSKFNFETPQSAIGESMYVYDSILVKIVGVVKNFDYAAMFLPKRPLVLRLKPDAYRIIALRIESGISPIIISKFKDEWNKIDKYNEFSGEFLDDEIKEYYSYFEDIIYSVGFTSVLAIVIACLGLLGMATYSTQTKIKEIGVRKVFGATTKSIITLISKTYLKLFLIAALIAGPLAYIINNAWLQYVANHVNFGFLTIFIGIFIIISFGMITIASQTLKAANTNPAQSLRYE